MGKLFRAFLSEVSEFHALWVGFCSAIYPFARDEFSENLKIDIENEYHYYLAGVMIGRFLIFFWFTIMFIAGMYIGSHWLNV